MLGCCLWILTSHLRTKAPAARSASRAWHMHDSSATRKGTKLLFNAWLVNDGTSHDFRDFQVIQINNFQQNLSCIMWFFGSTAIISCHLNKCQSSSNIMALCLNLESWYFQAWKEQHHLNRNPTSPHPLASRMHFPKFLPGSGVQWMTLPKPAELQGVLEPGNRWSFHPEILPLNGLVERKFVIEKNGWKSWEQNPIKKQGMKCEWIKDKNLWNIHVWKNKPTLLTKDHDNNISQANSTSFNCPKSAVITFFCSFCDELDKRVRTKLDRCVKSSWKCRTSWETCWGHGKICKTPPKIL